jgi:hypothetical protein
MVLAAVFLVACLPSVGAARAPGDPIRLAHEEGDVAGFGTIYGPDGGEPIGFVEFRQTRHGDLLSMSRVAHFNDGSSDEDSARVRVAGALEALGGRSVIRDAAGVTTVDLTFDIAGQRIRGSWGSGGDRKTVDDHFDLSPGTYWGPLIFMVLKNFDANATDGRVVFRAVVPTPGPRVIDLELVRMEPTQLRRTGAALDVTRYDLNPTVHWAIDPLIRAFIPASHFFVRQGNPPGLARFAGPRNYAGQTIRIE